MSKYSFIVDENDEGTRLDAYLSELFADVSRSKIQEVIKKGLAFVNSEAKKPSYKVRLAEKVEVEISPEEEIKIEPENIKLDVVYEDENMLVVNKPSGMLTHPTTIETTGTLVNALLFMCGENLSDMNGYFRRGILHRLDRNTSGLLMVAKNNKTHEYLADLIKKREITKKYLAVVKGLIKDDVGVIDLPVGRNPVQQHKMAVIKEDAGGKPSITGFKVLKRFKDATYLELDLKTGRTHQIRVHMSSLNHPIYNDSLYGGSGGKVKTQEQVLQAYKLSFTKPFSDVIIELEIEPDEKIKHVLKYLENQK